MPPEKKRNVLIFPIPFHFTLVWLFLSLSSLSLFLSSLLQFGLNIAAGRAWLILAQEARRHGQFETADAALMQAQRSGIPNVEIERAELLQARGRQHEAATYLDKYSRMTAAHPSPIISFHQAAAAGGGGGSHGDGGASSQLLLEAEPGTGWDELRRAISLSGRSWEEHHQAVRAKTYLLMGQWAQESGAKESRDVIAYYKEAMEAAPTWSKPYFQLAQYYDKLRHQEMQFREEAGRKLERNLHSMEGIGGRDGGSSSSSSRKRSGKSSGRSGGRRSRSGSDAASSGGGGGPPRPDSTEQRFLKVVLKNYSLSLMSGSEYVFQILPRMLTLWFDHSERWTGPYASTALRGGVSEEELLGVIKEAHWNTEGRSSSSSSSSSSARRRDRRDESLEGTYLACHETMMDVAKRLRPDMWLAALPQIISRLTHPNPDVMVLLRSILSQVFFAYPQQAVWQVAAVMKVADRQRRRRARALLDSIHKYAGLPSHVQELVDMACRRQGLFDQLLDFCQRDTPRRKQKLQLHKDFPVLAFWNRPDAPVGHRRPRSRIIVPLQSALTANIPTPSTNPLRSQNLAAAYQLSNRGRPARFLEDGGTAGGKQGKSRKWSRMPMASSSHQQQQQQQRGIPSLSQWSAELGSQGSTIGTLVTIEGFENEVQVLKSKERPKKLTIRGSDGKPYAFLCKKEARGDMRKNSRMMEVASVVNRLLQRDSDARRRKLQVRTFSVLPLSEECGLIEWVPFTTGYVDSGNNSNSSSFLFFFFFFLR